MIDRVLIAEDHESASISIQKTLEDLRVPYTDYVFYCDDALTKLINGQRSGYPYDLLITDLYFDEDGIPQCLKNGIELIKSARMTQPELKVLVFSAEHKATILESLFNQSEIDGYVRKARNDTKELKLAIEQISKNQKFFPRNITQLIKKKNTYEFTPFDIEIISLLASGISQKKIPANLLQKQIHPTSLSSIEKRLNRMKTELDFTNNEQLIAFCKDMGII